MQNNLGKAKLAISPFMHAADNVQHIKLGFLETGIIILKAN